MTRAVVPVAVLVPCHNYGQYLTEAIQSIAEQTIAPAELVVIDDGSTDETPEVLSRLMREFPQLPWKVVRHEQAIGFVPTLREGIAISEAPLIAHVDADDRVMPRYLESLCAALDAHAEAGYAYPRMRLFGNESGVYLSGPFNPARLVYEGNYIPHIGIMRRSAYERTRGYRDLVTHIDWDLWLSFLNADIPGMFVDEVLYEWRRHGGSMTLQPTRVRLGARVRVLTGHSRLVGRYLLPGLPYVLKAIWRQLMVKARLRANKYPRTDSCWLEPGS